MSSYRPILFFACFTVFKITNGWPSNREVDKESHLNLTEMCRKYGHHVKEFNVLTEDGYILKLFNIEGSKKSVPVLLMHGFMDSPDTFLLRGKKSLAIVLADRGYDVWAASVRGSKYGMGHVNLNPNREIFWNFTFHEMAYYDLTANIDFILKQTKAMMLNAIGHSQGNFIFYVMGSVKPEYNKKVNVLIALAPVAYIQHLRGAASVMALAVPMFHKFSFSAGVFVRNDIFKLLEHTFCKLSLIGYTLCGMFSLFSMAGFDLDELEPLFFDTLVDYFPSSISVKSTLHYSQLYRRAKLAQFDYGYQGNLFAYNSAEPPEYDLTKVSMKVILMQALNDNISTVEDTDMLKTKLPNNEYRVVKRKQCNHIDFVWGANMEQYIFPDVLEILEKYNSML